MKNNQVNPEDVQTIRYIQQHQQELNEFFKQMQFKKNDFQIMGNQQQKNNEQIKPKRKVPNFNTNHRGQKIYSIQDMRKNYQNAFFGTKWLTLPYCRRTVIGKIQFWCGASFIFTYMWASYHMRKNNITKVHWKFYRNTYGLFALASCTYVFLESMFFQPYCDINSYHYKTEGNLFVARDIKKQLKQISK